MWTNSLDLWSWSIPVCFSFTTQAHLIHLASLSSSGSNSLDTPFSKILLQGGMETSKDEGKGFMEVPPREGCLVQEVHHSVLARWKTARLIWLMLSLIIAVIKFVNFMPRLQWFFFQAPDNVSASSVAGFMNCPSLMKLKEVVAGVWRGTMSDAARIPMILSEVME